jgi:carboxyl-terminal processing protease
MTSTSARGFFGIAQSTRPLLLLAALLALLPAFPARADLGSPTLRDKIIAQHVAVYLERVHVRQWKLDDKRSESMFDSYLRALDPQRMYFTAADIESFKSSRYKIDDYIKSGDLDFAFKVGEVFLARVDGCSKRVKKLVEEEQDFTVDEYFEVDRAAAAYASGEKEVADLWRKRVKVLLLEKLVDGKAMKEACEEVAKLYDNFAVRMGKTDGMELLQIFLTAATMTYDPHTTYMSPDTLENFQISMRLELEGIGASLQSIDGYTVVNQVIPGGAAARDGRLKPQDKILAVAQGDSKDFVELLNMKLSDVVKLIRGKKGTRVQLKVRHADSEGAELVAIVRAKVVLSDREAHGEVLEVKRGKGLPALKVGVVVLPSFYMDMAAAGRGVKDFKSTTRDVSRIIRKFRADGIEAVVIDLRMNGGGALSEAIALTGLFVDTGPVVLIKHLNGKIDTRNDSKKGADWSGPLVVLTSKFSASASEIFAGALQDYKRAVIVGDRSTHGKGTVQQLMDLSRARGGGEPGKLGALKITLSQFYRPSGNSTQNKGVVPDIELPAVSSYMDGEAELDFSIEFDTVEKAEHADLGLVDQKVLRRLKEKSRKRRGSNEEFSRIEKDIARYRKIRDRKKIPLKRSRYEAEKKKFDPADAKEEKKDPRDTAAPPDDNEIKRDFYLEEVLSITADYVAALKPANAESYRRLARAALLLGDTKQGRALIAEGLRKHPGSGPLQKLKKGPVK